MASVLNRTTKQYLASADTLNYPPQDWLYNPDVSAVLNESEQIPTSLWIIPPDPPQVGAVIEAERLLWRKEVKLTELADYREELRLGPFHFDDEGDHANGTLYDANRFDTENVVYIVNSITSGIPALPPTIAWVPYSDTFTPSILNTEILTDSDFINFHSRYDETRELIRITFFQKYEEIMALTTEEEVDAYDVTAGWPLI